MSPNRNPVRMFSILKTNMHYLKHEQECFLRDDQERCGWQSRVLDLIKYWRRNYRNKQSLKAKVY